MDIQGCKCGCLESYKTNLNGDMPKVSKSKPKKLNEKQIFNNKNNNKNNNKKKVKTLKKKD